MTRITRRRLIGAAGALAAAGLLAACDRGPPQRAAVTSAATPQPSPAAVRIELSPDTPLVDERFSLRVTGLAPRQEITLRAALRDSAGRVSASRAEFTANT